LLESAYLECLFSELQELGLKVEKQKPLALVYKEVKLDVGYRIDLVVEGKVIIELNSIEALNEIHIAQVLTYLKLSACKIGLLMNFNVLRVVEGIKRFWLTIIHFAVLCVKTQRFSAVKLFLPQRYSKKPQRSAEQLNNN